MLTTPTKYHVRAHIMLRDLVALTLSYLAPRMTLNPKPHPITNPSESSFVVVRVVRIVRVVRVLQTPIRKRDTDYVSSIIPINFNMYFAKDNPQIIYGLENETLPI